MSEEPENVTRRSTLKRIAAGTALGVGTVTASSTAAADDCRLVTWCDTNCPFNEPRVATYECCEGDSVPEDCTLVSEDCGVMCP